MNGTASLYAGRPWVQKISRVPLPHAGQFRSRASRVVATSFIRKARAYAAFITGKKLSIAKSTGGALGEVAVQMLALAQAGDVHGVEQYLTFVQGVRDALLEDPGCARELTMREQIANAIEDEASLKYIAGGCAVELKEAIIAKQSINRLRVAALLRETVES